MKMKLRVVRNPPKDIYWKEVNDPLYVDSYVHLSDLECDQDYVVMIDEPMKRRIEITSDSTGNAKFRFP